MRYKSLWESQIDEPDFKIWFANSKIVDKNGRPLMVFHQTNIESAAAIEEIGFNINHIGARATDEQMPDGIFFKTIQDDIGVGNRNRTTSAVQMPFYLSIQNPLIVENRDFLHAFLLHDNMYKKFYQDVQDADARLAKAYDNLMAKSQRFFDNGTYSKVSEKLNIQVDRYLNRVCAIARKRSTEVIKNNGYDGLWMTADKGGGLFGNKFVIETIVAFDNNQVKSAKKDRQDIINKSWGIGR